MLPGPLPKNEELVLGKLPEACFCLGRGSWVHLLEGSCEARCYTTLKVIGCPSSCPAQMATLVLSTRLSNAPKLCQPLLCIGRP